MILFKFMTNEKNEFEINLQKQNTKNSHKDGLTLRNDPLCDCVALKYSSTSIYKMRTPKKRKEKDGVYKNILNKQLTCRLS